MAVMNLVKRGVPAAGRDGTVVFTDTVNKFRVVYNQAKSRIITVIPGV